MKGKKGGPVILVQAILNAMMSPEQERQEELEKELQGIAVTLVLGIPLLVLAFAGLKSLVVVGFGIESNDSYAWVFGLAGVFCVLLMFRWSEKHFESNKLIIKALAASIRTKVPYGYLGLHFIVWSVFILVIWIFVLSELGYLPDFFVP